MSEIDIEGAIEIVRSYFRKIRGEDELVSSLDLPHSNLIGFDVIDAMEEEDVYVIRCELKENIFSSKKLRYTVKVDVKGEIKEVKRENE